VDKTISGDVSWLRLTSDLGADPDVHGTIFNAFLANNIDYPTAKKQLLDLWTSTGNASKEFMRQVFYSWQLKSDAKEIVEYLRAGYALCLMSGSMDLYVQTVADKLTIADWYANTELIWDNQDNLIDLNYFRNQSARKLVHLKDYFTKYPQFNASNTLIVGDGDSDLELFRTLKYGIVVTKDRQHYPELESLAYASITELSELANLL